MKSKKRYIDAIEVSKNRTTVVLDDGSTLEGLIRVQTSSAMGEVYAVITAYVLNDNTVLPEREYDA